MKSKQTKTHIKQQLLLESLSQHDSLSIKQIMELLSCNRQSAYNYIKKLESNGYRLSKQKENGCILYSLVPTEDDTLQYTPLSMDILRKYTILQELENDPVDKDRFRKHFTVYTPDELNDMNDHVLLDVGLTQYYNLIKDLTKNGDIDLIKETQKYCLTGKNVPLQMTLKTMELNELNLALSTISAGSVYYEDLKNIYHKTNVLLGYVDENIPHADNYYIYGRKSQISENVKEKLELLQKYNYKEHLLQISYTSKQGQPLSVLFATGKIVYSVEKDAVYLLGQKLSTENEHGDIQNIIIDLSTINDIKETSQEHSCYNSELFTDMFHTMFGVSTEPPVSVEVRFDIHGNIERKIRYLHCQRPRSAIRTDTEKNQIIYTDTIRGLSDFAAYLRRFGKSAHVIRPAELKERMDRSVAWTLQRYEEEENHE